MVEYNRKINEKHLFCDKCQKEIKDNVYILSMGDTFCEKCFNKSYEIKTAQEYLDTINIPDNDEIEE